MERNPAAAVSGAIVSGKKGGGTNYGRGKERFRMRGRRERWESGNGIAEGTFVLKLNYFQNQGGPWRFIFSKKKKPSNLFRPLVPRRCFVCRKPPLPEKLFAINSPAARVH